MEINTRATKSDHVVDDRVVQDVALTGDAAVPMTNVSSQTNAVPASIDHTTGDAHTSEVSEEQKAAPPASMTSATAAHNKVPSNAASSVSRALMNGSNSNCTEFYSASAHHDSFQLFTRTTTTTTRPTIATTRDVGQSPMVGWLPR